MNIFRRSGTQPCCATCDRYALRHLSLLLMVYSVSTAPLFGVDITTSTNWTVDGHSTLYSNDVVVIRNCTVTLASHTNYGSIGVYYFSQLVLTNNATVICQGQTNFPYNELARGVCIEASNVSVYAGCTLHANGQGFLATNGPGAGTSSGSAATYGGMGGNNWRSRYGSITNPLSLGSGGYSASGGGALHLKASHQLLLQGVISANGTAGNWGGGSGGSVWIEANTFSGGGRITANGGPGSSYWYGADGGGGRIAIQFQSSTFTGKYALAGGGAYIPGYPGTLSVPENTSLILTNDIALAAGTYNIPLLVLSNGASLHCQGDTNSTYGSGVILNCSTVQVYSGSKIFADLEGFPATQGPGAGTFSGAAGTYGGKGGRNPAAPRYGSATNPLALGSGGYSSSGGGAIHLVVSNSLLVHGTISADSVMGNYGSGSGGSVWIQTDSFSGGGTISANGGPGNSYEGRGADGGGGRVAVEFASSTFTGTYSVAGGRTYSPGYPGTLSLPNQVSWIVKSDAALAPGTYDIPLLIVTNSASLHCQGDTNSTYGSGVTLNCYTVQVYSGAKIFADGEGFPSKEGPAGGLSSTHGGTHGGAGTYNPRSTYGSATNPVALGSAGYDASGSGGGSILLMVSNNLLVNGAISADGLMGSFGGGAGGSILIRTDRLAGNGSITAKGGAGSSYWSGGGGGGGRIAVYCLRNYYAGAFTAMGGLADVYAGTGTVVFGYASPSAPVLHTPIHCPDAGPGGPVGDNYAVYGRTLNPRPPLQWRFPTNAGATSIAFKVYYDTTTGTVLQASSSNAVSGFMYYTGTNWMVYPSEGLLSTNTAILISYQPQSDIFSYLPRPASSTHVFWRVEALCGTIEGPPSETRRFDLGGRAWTDEHLLGAFTRIRNDHIYELREEINYARVSRKLATNAWTNPILIPGQSHIRVLHLAELRTALEPLTNLTGITLAPWTDSILIPKSTPIKTNHVQELRKGLESL